MVTHVVRTVTVVPVTVGELQMLSWPFSFLMRRKLVRKILSQCQPPIVADHQNERFNSVAVGGK